jgi:hypothetical protein
MSDRVVGVITAGVNLELGQNLNFAVPCSEVKALLVTAHQHAKPLNSIASRSEDSLTEGIVWTSLMSGHDYSLRQDGDYLYVDWVNVPPEIKTAGGFVRSKLKKSPDGKWRGKAHSRLPCTYQKGLGVYARNVTNWCSRNDDTEIDLLSDKRIEGIGTSWEKFDCKKCEPEGVGQKPFRWIPK